MPICPVCKKESSSLLCPCCGFDGSCHYEQYPTLGIIEHTTAVSQLAAARNKIDGTLFCCPDCSGNQFFLDIQNNRVICVNCRNRFPMNGIGKTKGTAGNTSKAAQTVKTASTQEILDKYLSGNLQTKEKSALSHKSAGNHQTKKDSFYIKKESGISQSAKTASTQEILDKYLSGNLHTEETAAGNHQQKEEPFYIGKDSDPHQSVKTASTQEILDKYLSTKSAAKNH